MKKEDILKILLTDRKYSIATIGKVAENIADEILALDKKEESIPEYIKCIHVNNSWGNKFTYNKIYKTLLGTTKEAYHVISDGNHNYLVGNIPLHIEFKEATKEEFDKQQLKEQIANLKHGKWYKASSVDSKKFFFKFNKVLGNDLFTTDICYGSHYKRTCGHLDVNTITSITLATNEEVEKYYPDEFLIRDYEIREFFDGYNKYWRTQAGNFTINTQHFYLEQVLLLKNYSITRVKRLSDNEIFNVGDRVTCWDGIKTIKSICFAKSTKTRIGFMMEGQIGDNSCSYTIDHIKKIKELEGYKILDSKLCRKTGESLIPFSQKEITSVKRLSDNEIFTIGDRWVDNNDKIYTITEITLSNCNDGCYLNGIASNNDSYIGKSLESAIKYITKNPIIKTQDGVDIFAPTPLYLVHPTTLNIVEERTIFNPSAYKGWLVFANKSNMDEYILEHKPCLSIKDVQSIYVSANPGYNKNGKGIEYFTKLKNLVKSKL